MRPCCARLQSRLTAEQADLRSVARRAAGLEARGRRADKLRAAIPSLKARVAEAEQAIVDHEAEHAGEELAG